MTEKSSSPTSTEPVISVSAPFGDLTAEDLAPQDDVPRDYFYVQGYSDRRTRYDEAVRQRAQAIEEHRTPPPLPKPLEVRMQFVRTTRLGGQEDRSGISRYKANGYEVLTDAHIQRYGIDPKASNFVKEADGTYRVGSQVCMVAPASRVRANAAKNAEAQQAQREGLLDRANREAAAFNRQHGLSASGGTAFDYVEEDTTSEYR